MQLKKSIKRNSRKQRIADLKAYIERNPECTSAIEALEKLG